MYHQMLLTVEGGNKRGAVKKQVIFSILGEISPIYDTVFPKRKRKQYLEALGSFSGDNLFYF